MGPVPYPPRARPDACPGALTTHAAADGQLARVRLPGGRLTAGQLHALAACADDLGDGELHLTSRGNLQLRGLSSATELAERLAAAGLLPSATHERVRNIVASPLSGLVGGLADVRPLVPELDAAICATPELADLPGRFLFGLDDGRRHIVDDRIDVCWSAVGAESGSLLLAGVDVGVRVPVPAAVAALTTAAAAFAAVRGDAWQVRELDAAGVDALVTAVVGGPGRRVEDVERPECRGGDMPAVGVLARDGGRCVLQAGLAFGVLRSEQARALAGLADTVVLTPWRSVVLADVAPTAIGELESAGFVLDPAAPELTVSACIGRPGCAKSMADVRADATQVSSELAALANGAPVQAHFAGCSRRCGRPAGSADVLADGAGYVVDGTPVTVEQLAKTLAGKGRT